MLTCWLLMFGQNGLCSRYTIIDQFETGICGIGFQSSYELSSIEIANTDAIIPPEIINYFKKFGWEDPCGSASAYPVNYVRNDLDNDGKPEYLLYSVGCSNSNQEGELYIFDGKYPYRPLGDYTGYEITGSNAIAVVFDPGCEFKMLRLGDWEHDERNCVHRHIKYNEFSRQYESINTPSIEENPVAVILIHGLNGKHTTWDEAITGLSEYEYKYYGNYQYVSNGRSCSIIHDINYGYEGRMSQLKTPVFTLDFSDNQNLSFAQQATELRAILGKITIDYGYADFILVGHSMGGIAIRRYLMDYGTNGITGVVTITAPHLGSYLAYANDNKILNRVTGLSTLMADYKIIYGLDYNSAAVNMLKPSSPEMKEMFNKVYPENLPTAVIISTWSSQTGRSIASFLSAIWGSNYCNIQQECPLSLVNNGNLVTDSDGVVTVPSQDLGNAVSNREQLKLFYFYTDRFHMDTNKDVGCLKNALSVVRLRKHD